MSSLKETEQFILEKEINWGIAAHAGWRSSLLLPSQAGAEAQQLQPGEVLVRQQELLPESGYTSIMSS